MLAALYDLLRRLQTLREASRWEREAREALSLGNYHAAQIALARARELKEPGSFGSGHQAHLLEQVWLGRVARCPVPTGGGVSGAGVGRAVPGRRIALLGK